MVSEVERDNGDVEHTYAHLAHRSTSAESQELVTVIPKKFAKRSEPTGSGASKQKLRRKKQLPASTSESSEHSKQRAEHDGELSRSWKLGRFSIQRSARKPRDPADLEHATPVGLRNFASPSDSPAASRLRRPDILPSSTTKVDSAVATQETKPRRHQVESDQSGGGQMINTMADESQDLAPPRSMFQQPGMTRRQSNVFVFEPVP